ncbi:translation initiation factor 2 subunit 2 [Entomortierella parvispora]|uniref:Translation initiation factor 2 subunit 2 n=1 Tax=Entomortierella parvispora TaxID=205924 RepID=A0A9P3LSI7_9FUNG|nr:translation initiation factor 2 subunit 2 [Entomortierella parvispora]
MSEIEEKLESMEIQDDELVFDLSMKKKKKKSKKTEEEAVEETAEAQEAAPATDAAEEDPMAMFGEKKKKKKKVKTEDETAEGGEEPAAEGESFDFGDMKKKKKKSKKVDFSAFEDGQEQEGEDGGARDPDDVFAADDEDGSRSAAKSGAEAEEGWIGTNRDYTYTELLSRVFKILRQNNPELAGEKKRYTIVPPSVMRDGNKKTVFANVADICKRMHRQPEHVIQFLFAELGTSGSIDGSQRLVIKGRFQQKQIEAVLRRYIVEYVTCKTCKSPDTILTKENRLFFLQCEACGSTRSVSAIKSGFQAQTGKRAAQRVKAAA